MDNNDAKKAPETMENKEILPVADTSVTSSEEKVDITPETTPDDSESAIVAEESTLKTTDVAIEDVKVESEPVVEKAVLEDVDHSSLTKEQLVNRLKTVLGTLSIMDAKSEVMQIKNAFNQKHRDEVETAKAKFLEQEGEEKDFLFANDPVQEVFSELMKQYGEAKGDYIRNLEVQKQSNLQLKYDIIEEIKGLVDREESMNQTFRHFKTLQDRWRDVGAVPQANMKDLWNTYHHHVENFYDYIKINKELRDLDFKRNSEAKLELCEKADALLVEENPQEAFDKLQSLHEEWREVGPVDKADREVLWNRFRESTRKINKRNQKHYDDLRKQQKDNLLLKEKVCEEVEELCKLKLERPQDWNDKAAIVQRLQKEWREIGPAPKKNNDEIFLRFRNACDQFFEIKRLFYNTYKEEKDHNLDLKKALCEKAEAYKDSTDWKRTTEELIKIQREWKKIGPVPRKYSDVIWKRFREACDLFFNKKTEFFRDIDSIQDANLQQKKELIEEIEKFELGDSLEENLKVLHGYKDKWNEIGHVPFTEKDNVYNLYRNTINRHFDKLDINEYDRELEKFKSKVDDIANSQNSGSRFDGERLKLVNKKKILESEVTVWENNIGFFSSSKKSSALVVEFEKKIAKARERLKLLDEKIAFLDNADQ